METNQRKIRQAQLPPPAICQNCGLKYDPRRPHCPKCGYPNSTPKQQQNKKTYTARNIIITAAVVAVVLVLLFTPFIKPKPQERTATTSRERSTDPVTVSIRESLMAVAMQELEEEEQKNLSINDISTIKVQAEMYIEKLDNLSNAQLPIKPNVIKYKNGVKLGEKTYSNVYQLDDSFEYQGSKHKITIVMAVENEGTKLLAYNCPDTGREFSEDYEIID